MTDEPIANCADEYSSSAHAALPYSDAGLRNNTMGMPV